MGLNNCPLCRRCGAEDETSASVCECEGLASLRHVYLGSFSLYPEEIKEFKSGGRGTQWPSWLRHCATSRKVAGSIADGVIGIFH